MAAYLEFEVSLRHIEPRIYRRFLLKDTASFRDLHLAIQDAGDWENYHLFEFRTRDRDSQTIAGIVLDDDGPFLDDPPPDAVKVKLRSFFARTGQKCIYLYDFGDGWELDVRLKRTVEMPERFRRRLLDGARAFPPEDCGGVWGYYDCLAALGLIKLDGPGFSKKEIKERREWLGDWQAELDLKKCKAAFDC